MIQYSSDRLECTQLNVGYWMVDIYVQGFNYHYNMLTDKQYLSFMRYYFDFYASLHTTGLYKEWNWKV